MVLVDTNIWIHAFKNANAVVIPVLTQLTLEKHSCFTNVVRTEILSGARNETEYRFLEDTLLAIPLLEDYPNLWNEVARARFQLARIGIQEGLVDLSIACMARHHGSPLWTLDKRFTSIQQVVAFKRFEPDLS